MIRIHDAFSEGGGPSFDEGDAISIDDPSDSVIQGKFGKTYETDHQIELLVYYGHQPVLSDIKKLKALAQTLLPSGTFKRIWGYDLKSEQVVFEFP